DQLRHTEDHLCGRRVLTWLSVDEATQAETLRVRHLVDGHQPRSQGIERLAALPLGPLPAGVVELKVAFGDVVRDGVTRHVVEGLLGRSEVTGAPSNDDTQLDLPI